MKKNEFVMFFFLVLVYVMMPKSAMAFSCTSNGLGIGGGGGAFTIPIDVTIDKQSKDIILADMSQYITCSGYQSFQDALRTDGGAVLSSLLTNAGYTGFLINPSNNKYYFPIGQLCVWVDDSCSTSFPDNTPIPLRVKLGMTKTSTSAPIGVLLPTGAEIVRIGVRQRSNGLWGNYTSWIFTAKNPITIPSYSCTISSYDQTVSLPTASTVDIQNNGVGIYPSAVRPFNINLNCEPKTVVSIQFDGTTMTGMTDVLANSSSGNTNIGVQLLLKGVPIVFGRALTVINSAQPTESLSFNAYYYWNGGVIKSGSVTAVSTFTLTYN